MKTQSVDTHPKAEEAQIALLRQASVAKRALWLRSLSQTVLRLSQRAIRKANPGLNERELQVLFVRYCYGDDLADHLQTYLNRKTHGTV
jgi:hypothetical protein